MLFEVDGERNKSDGPGLGAVKWAGADDLCCLNGNN